MKQKICPHHIRPVPLKDENGKLTGRFLAVSIDCLGSGKSLIDGKFCSEFDCRRDMTYKADEIVEREIEFIEVLRDYSRTCCKCEKVEHGKLKSFHWNELNKFWEASEYEFPEGWSVFHHTTYRDKQIGTVFNIYLCRDCTPTVLKFIGWRKQ